MTVWKEIRDFPRYVVSECGEVANIKDYIPLVKSKRIKTHTTYLRVTLFKEGKKYFKRIHRLVAEAFIPNPDNLEEVDHIDSNGENNHRTNLAWASKSENVRNSFLRNTEVKLAICTKGGKQAGAIQREKSKLKHMTMLGDRFLEFIPSGVVHKFAAVKYLCHCGTERTAAITYRELTEHKGTCPECQKKC